MTAETIAGPPCDICGEHAATLSLMNYADYGQMKLCPGCAPDFMRAIADSIDGRQTADSPGEAEPDPTSNSGSVAGAQDFTSTASESDDDEPGSAKDHWASTTHVRRSTHGHRGGTRRPDDTPKGEPA